MSFVRSFATLVVLFCASLYFSKKRVHSCGTIRISDIDKAEQILRNSELKQRAPPNQRLVEHFGIHNYFTTADQKVQKAFLGLCKDLLRTEDLQWEQIASYSSGVVRQLS